MPLQVKSISANLVAVLAHKLLDLGVDDLMVLAQEAVALERLVALCAPWTVLLPAMDSSAMLLQSTSD